MPRDNVITTAETHFVREFVAAAFTRVGAVDTRFSQRGEISVAADLAAQPLEHCLKEGGSTVGVHEV